jgi:hypothetical protein
MEALKAKMLKQQEPIENMWNLNPDTVTPTTIALTNATSATYAQFPTLEDRDFSVSSQLLVAELLLLTG